MNIHDLIFTAGSLVFLFALVPSIVGDHKPAFWTSILTAVVLAIFVVDYYSIRYWFAGSTTAITSTLWFILAFQGRPSREAEYTGTTGSLYYLDEKVH